MKAKKVKKEKSAEVAAPSWQARQLFVSGIPYDATKDQLLEFFAVEKGVITEVKMPTF